MDFIALRNTEIFAIIWSKKKKNHKIWPKKQQNQ